MQTVVDTKHTQSYINMNFELTTADHALSEKGWNMVQSYRNPVYYILLNDLYRPVSNCIKDLVTLGKRKEKKRMKKEIV